MHHGLHVCSQQHSRGSSGLWLQGVTLLLPEDVVCTYDLNADESCCTQPLTRGCCTKDAPCIPDDAYGADIGPKSAVRFAGALQGCKTIFWNGPMGRFEIAAYAHGTCAIAEGVAAEAKKGATTVVGGAKCSQICIYARGQIVTSKTANSHGGFDGRAHAQ